MTPSSATSSLKAQTYNSVDPIKYRVRLTQALLIASLCATFGAWLVTWLTNGELPNGTPLRLGLSAFFGVTAFVMSRQIFQQSIINGMVVVMALLPPMLNAFNTTELALVSISTISLSVSAVLAGRWVYRVTLVGLGGWLFYQVILRIQQGVITSGGGLDPISDVIVMVALPLVLSVLVRWYTNMLVQSTEETKRASVLLEATAGVGAIITHIRDLDALLMRSADAIRDRFGYSHVQIFMVDENDAYAYVRASTGAVGQALIERHYRLPIASDNVIGRVVQARVPLIIEHRRRTADRPEEDLRVHSRSEASLPIMGGDRVVGVLDIQSTRQKAFNQVDLQALQVVTAQLASAIRNAQLFENQERSLRENRRLYEEAETNLRENQRLNQRLTGQTWLDYLGRRQGPAGVTLDTVHFLSSAEWTSAMQKAAETLEPVVLPADNPERRTLAVPVQLRQQVVGAIEVDVAAKDVKAALEVLRPIADRMAISLDNARLFEESQIITAQEQRVGAMAAQYQSVTSVDELLQVTLQGLAEVLGAEGGAIRLGSLSETIENPGTNGNGRNGHNGHAEQNGGSHA